MSEYLADEGLLHELLDLRRGLDRLLNRLDKNLPVGEVARQMDERLCEIILPSGYPASP
jgi:hypothetical protein